MSMTQQEKAYVRSLATGEYQKTLQQAEAEKAPLKRDEYFAVKYLMGLVPAVRLVREKLDKRLRGFGRARSNLGMALYCLQNLEDTVLETMPLNQLKILNKEIENTEIYARTNAPTPYINDEHDYVPVSRADLNKLVSYVVAYSCDMCDLQGKAASKCPVSKLMRRIMIYDVPATMKTGECFFNTYQSEASDNMLTRLIEYDREAAEDEKA